MWDYMYVLPQDLWPARAWDYMEDHPGIYRYAALTADMGIPNHVLIPYIQLLIEAECSNDYQHLPEPFHSRMCLTISKLYGGCRKDVMKIADSLGFAEAMHTILPQNPAPDGIVVYHCESGTPLPEVSFPLPEETGTVPPCDPEQRDEALAVVKQPSKTSRLRARRAQARATLEETITVLGLQDEAQEIRAEQYDVVDGDRRSKQARYRQHHKMRLQQLANLVFIGTVATLPVHSDAFANPWQSWGYSGGAPRTEASAAVADPIAMAVLKPVPVLEPVVLMPPPIPSPEANPSVAPSFFDIKFWTGSPDDVRLTPWQQAALLCNDAGRLAKDTASELSSTYGHLFYVPAKEATFTTEAVPVHYHVVNICMCILVILFLTTTMCHAVINCFMFAMCVVRIVDKARPIVCEGPQQATKAWYAMRSIPAMCRVRYAYWRERHANPYAARDSHKIAAAILEVLTPPPKAGDRAPYPLRVEAALACPTIDLPAPFGCPWCVHAYNQLEGRSISLDGVPCVHSCVSSYDQRPHIKCFDGVIGLVLSTRSEIVTRANNLLEITRDMSDPQLTKNLEVFLETPPRCEVKKGKNKERHNVDRKHYAGRIQVWTDDEYNRKKHLIDEGRYDLVEEMLIEKYASAMGDNRGAGMLYAGIQDGMSYEQFKSRELGGSYAARSRHGYEVPVVAPPRYFVADGETTPLYHGLHQLQAYETMVKEDKEKRMAAIEAVSPPEAYVEENPPDSESEPEVAVEASRKQKSGKGKNKEAGRRSKHRGVTETMPALESETDDEPAKPTPKPKAVHQVQQKYKLNAEEIRAVEQLRKNRAASSPLPTNAAPVSVIKQEAVVCSGIWDGDSGPNPVFVDGPEHTGANVWTPVVSSHGAQTVAAKIESPTHGGSIRSVDEMPNAAMLWDFEEVNKHIGWLNGFFVRGPCGPLQTSMYFVTARHLNETGDGDPVAYFREPRVVKMTKFPHVKAFSVKAQVYEATMDRMVLNVDYTSQHFTQPRFTAPKVGGAVTLIAFDGDAWNFSQGEVTAVSTGRDTFNYNASTKGGFCRTPVLTRSGAICGGHFGGSVTIGCVSNPAGWVETGTVRKSIEEFRPVSLNNEAPVQAPPPNLRAFRRREFQKIFPLRTDIVFNHVRHRHIMMKPSTTMLKDEVGRYVEELPLSPAGIPRVIDQARLRQAFGVVCKIETDKIAGCSIPWSEPTLFDAVERLRPLLTGTHTSGANSHVLSQSEYIASLCQDTSIVDADARGLLGLQELARKVLQYISDVSDGVVSDITQEFDEICDIWLVMGKKDGYKPKKLQVGRSVQAPCVMLKALWLVMFKPSDDAWSSRDFMFREGFDFNRALPRHLRVRYERILKSLSLDATAWDRFFPKEFLQMFHAYMGLCNPGAPPNVIQKLYQWTTMAELLFTDGTSVQKERGNPSGHPNTLRLNCFGNFLAWVYVLLENHTPEEVYELIVNEDLFFEFCGDDSRVSALTPRGFASLDKDLCLSVFSRDLPWVMKIEGYWVRDVTIPLHIDILDMPPFISRNTMIIDNIMWTPYLDPSRVLRKLLHEMGRTPDNEEELVTNMNDILGLLDYWDRSGRIKCPPVAEAREKLPQWSYSVSRNVAARHYLLYYTS